MPTHHTQCANESKNQMPAPSAAASKLAPRASENRRAATNISSGQPSIVNSAKLLNAKARLVPKRRTKNAQSSQPLLPESVIVPSGWPASSLTSYTQLLPQP